MTTQAPTRTWAEFRPQVERALEYAGGTHTVGDVEDALLAGDAQLWVQGDGLVVSEIEDMPQKRVMRLWLAAGELADITSLWPDIRAFAAEQGCDRMVVLGRRGWWPTLESLGWRRTLVVYETEV